MAGARDRPAGGVERRIDQRRVTKQGRGALEEARGDAFIETGAQLAVSAL
jgi:hypothetical protein